MFCLVADKEINSIQVTINTVYTTLLMYYPLLENVFIATRFGPNEIPSGNVQMFLRKLLYLQRIHCFFWVYLTLFVICYLIAFRFGYNIVKLIELRLSITYFFYLYIKSEGHCRFSLRLTFNGLLNSVT
jgi:hypothetical protein